MRNFKTRKVNETWQDTGQLREIYLLSPDYYSAWGYRVRQYWQGYKNKRCLNPGRRWRKLEIKELRSFTKHC